MWRRCRSTSAQAASASAVSEDQGVALLHIAQHAQLASDPPDLAVWGEGALDPGAANDPRVVADVQRAIAAVGAPTLVGAVLDDPDGTQHTSAILFDGSGQLAGRYDKVHLVPFGEYVPWRDELSWISAIQQIPVDRTPGERVHTLSTAGLPAFGTPICFENSFPELTRAFVRDGRGVPRGSGEQRVLRDDGGIGPAPPDEPHARGGGRPVGRGRRRLGHQRVRRSHGTHRVAGRAVPTGDPAPHDPVIGRRSRRTSASGTGSRGSRSSSSPGWCWCPAGVRASGPPRSPLSPDRCRTLVILPTYEERDTIEWVLARLLALPEHLDILVVDDSSPDGTGELVRAVAAHEPRVRLLERPGKSGLGSAYLDGLPHGSRGGLRPVRRDGFGPVARARGAAAAARGGGVRPRPRRREPVRAGRIGHRLEPLARGAVEGREHLRPPDARPAHPGRDQRVPRLPAPRARSARRACRCIPTATGSRSSW